MKLSSPQARRKNRRSKSILLAFLTLFLLDAPSKASDIHFQTGVKYFNSNQPVKALNEFKLAAKEEPSNALASYYVAVTLVKCKRISEALPFFQQTKRNAEPNSELAQMAAKSLEAFNKPVELPGIARTESGALVPTISVDGGAGSGLFGNTRDYQRNTTSGLSSGITYRRNIIQPGINSTSPRSTGQLSNGKPLPTSFGLGHGGSGNAQTSILPPDAASRATDPAAAQALRSISNQAQDRISSTFGNTDSRYEQINNPAARINQIQTRAQRQIERLQNQPLHYRRRGYYRNIDAEIERIQRTADEQSAEIRRIVANGDAAQRRAACIKESADNLSSQILSQRLTGSGIRLVPEGTNLHVRNYESFHSDDDDRNNVLPLVAKPMSLKDIDAQTTPQKGKAL